VLFSIMPPALGKNPRSVWRHALAAVASVECDAANALNSTNDAIFYCLRRRAGGETVMEKQVIEYAGVPVGITIQDGDRLKFIAVKYPVIALDGGSYQSVSELQSAIHRHIQETAADQEMFRVAANGATASAAAKVFSAA
jgi:hypothetical protein